MSFSCANSVSFYKDRPAPPTEKLSKEQPMIPHPLRLAVGSHSRGSGRGCAMKDCERVAKSRGLCDAHYHSERYHGRLSNVSEDDRWSRFVEPGAPDQCWEWRGWRSPQGYGRFTINGKQIPAPRAAAMRAGMDVQDGLDVCHTCDNPPCVNPTHLYVGTRSRNLLDMAERGRHPKRGLGERDWNAKYTDADVADWRASHAAGESFKSIARRYGAHATTISRTVRGLQRRSAA